MEKKFVSVVLYLHNNEDTVESFLETVIRRIGDNFEHYELICVDDDCTDGTVENLKGYLKENLPEGVATIVHMGSYQGQEASINAGRDISIGDFVYEFDTTIVDYQLDTVVAAYELICKGSDIVIAAPQGGRKLSSRMFYAIYNHFSKSSVQICSDTFRIISRRAINRIKSVSDFVPYRKALYSNCGLKVETLFYREDPEKWRGRKNNTGERVDLAFDSFIYFTNFLERVSLFIALFFLVFLVGSVGYVMWDYFGNGNVAEGWTSTICFLAFGFFGMFLLLTIVLKYLSVLVDMVFRRQKYLVSSVEKIGGDV